MADSSRKRAQTWQYPRHQDFERLLRSAAARWFAGKDFLVQTKYPYILSDLERWPQNIIVPEVVEYIVAERAHRQTKRIGFPLHKYAHHGLSSQALLFNLVGPLIVWHDLEPLQRALERDGIPWPTGAVTASFEREDRTVFNEDSGQPTSIDLVIEGDHPSPVLYLECKFVEREFGGCSVFSAGDCDGRNPAQDFDLCFLHHIGRKYWLQLEKHGFLLGTVTSNATCILASYYQFFREVLFAIEKHGHFILLCDERNPTFVSRSAEQVRGLYPFLLSFVPDGLKAKVKILTIQQVVAAIKTTARHGDWITEFERKYGLVTP